MIDMRDDGKITNMLYQKKSPVGRKLAEARNERSDCIQISRGKIDSANLTQNNQTARHNLMITETARESVKCASLQ